MIARVVLAVVIAATGTSALLAQAGRSQSPPPPRGLSGVLPAGDSGTEWNPAGSPSASPAGSASTALDDAIASLTREIDARRGLAADTIEPLPTLADVTGVVTKYRRAYESMRERLYMGDPKPGSAAALAFEAFDAHWGALAPRIWTGARTTSVMRDDEWQTVVRRVRGARCPLAVAVPDRVQNRVLTGPEWACLSDTYFEDLVDFEVRAIEASSAARAEAVRPLGSALDDLDGWLRETASRRTLAPNHPDLRRQAAWHLHRAWMSGAIARRNELVRLRDRSPESPYQRFSRHAPALDAAPNSEVLTVRVAAGQRLTARLGATTREAPVSMSQGMALAKELYDVHFRRRMVGPRLVEAGMDASTGTILAKQAEIDPARRDVLSRIAAR